MFSPKIVDSDAFLDMPISTQALYFHLGMRADDDGFVNPRKIMRMIGASDDDLRVLVGRRFVLPFENGVVVIKHWKINNLIRKDWYQETIYGDLKKRLKIKENGAYTELVNETLPLSSTQDRLGKVSIGNKHSDENEEHVRSFDAFWKAYPRKVSKPQSLKAWIRLRPDAELQSKILAAIEVHKKSRQWVKDDGVFIPHPSTWLNQRRWEDEMNPDYKNSSDVTVLPYP